MSTRLQESNERTSGNGAVALWFHAHRLGRAVTAMGFVARHRPGAAALCVRRNCLLAL
jgi:hypothetical protein